MNEIESRDADGVQEKQPALYLPKQSLVESCTHHVLGRTVYHIISPWCGAAMINCPTAVCGGIVVSQSKTSRVH